jgi:hypothetical protein
VIGNECRTPVNADFRHWHICASADVTSIENRRRSARHVTCFAILVEMRPWGALCVGLAAAACGGVAHDGTNRGGVPTPGAGGARDAGGSVIIVHPTQGLGGSSNGGFTFGAGGVAGSSVGGSTFTGGTAGRAAGGEAGATNCTQTFDRLFMDVIPSVPVVDAGMGPFETIDFATDGRIVGLSRTTFEIDGCPANADCDAQVRQFTLDAPGLDVSRALFPGALVHVHYKRGCGWGCTSDIAVTSLDSWGGYANAAPAATGLYLAADDGGGSVGEMMYRVNRTLLPCDTYPRGGVCAENAGLYSLEFDFDDASWVVVPMGEERVAPYRGGLLSIRNLRSFETGYCDDYWNWAHWMVNARFER